MKSINYKTALAILLIGIGSGVFSYLLHVTVELVSRSIGTSTIFSFQAYVLSIIFGVSSYFLTKKIFNDTSGSGIPQVKLALIAYKGRMPRRMPIGKFLTSFLTLCTGLSFGKEGPLVTISASWGHLIAHLLKFNRQVTKVLVASGATAGLSAAFNTPIAAVVFTIEEILGELNTKYLGTIVVTSVLASATSYKLLGNKSTFMPLSYQFHIEWHLLLYLVLGLVMSIVGYLLVEGILYGKKVKSAYFKDNEYIYVIIVITLVGLASLYVPDILGDGIDTINNLLGGQGVNYVSSLFIILLLKIFLTSTSYSTGLSGGLFMPVLFTGAVGGALFGLALQNLGVSKIEPGVFALLGMTSLLVSVIRAPFTAFVMLFEMTRDYELILPLMISSIGAFWISNLMTKESVYELVAEYEGVHLPTHSDNECLNEMIVEECMTRDILSLESNDLIKDVIETVNASNYGGFPVLKNNKLIGVVNRCEIQEKFKEDPSCKIRNVAKYSVISIYPDQSLLVALDKMKRFDIGRLPVVSRLNDGLLLGLITPEDIVDYLGLSKSDDS